MKILVLCLPGIGDALMATPMIHLLKKENPHASIDVVCMFKSVEYVFKNNPYIDNVYYVDIYKKNIFHSIREILSLRKHHYDISFLAYPAFRREYHIVQYLIGAKKRIAHKFPHGYFSECNFLDTDTIDMDETVHNVINNLNLLNILRIESKKEIDKENISYDLSLMEEDIVFGKKYVAALGWKKNDIIGIHPGSIDSKAGIFKRWPTDHFIALIQHLIKQHKKVLVFVGPFEKEIGSTIVNNIADVTNCRLVTQTTFGQTLGIINQLSLLISNDNGFAHLANGLKIQGIVLFGPTNPLWCAPYDKQFVSIIRRATFEPWFRNDMKVTNPPKGVKSGMEKIVVSDILEVIGNREKK